MNTILQRRVQMFAIGICSLFLMIVISACSGVAGTGSGGSGSAAITGSIQAVNATAHSVTVSVSANGQQQQFVVGGLTDVQVTELQANVGKTYTFQVTQNGNSYTITTGSNPQADSNATQGVSNTTNTTTTTMSNDSQTTGANESGSIDFIGKVQSTNGNSLTVSMPNGDTLSVNITAQTDRGDLLNGQVNQGQTIKVDAIANAADGSFIANKLDQVDPEDMQNPVKLNTVDFTGITTSAVGTDNVIHFRVGNKDYSFTSGPTTQMEDFANNQGIASNQSIKVDVQYNGSAATVLKVGNGND